MKFGIAAIFLLISIFVKGSTESSIKNSMFLNSRTQIIRNQYDYNKTCKFSYAIRCIVHYICYNNDKNFIRNEVIRAITDYINSDELNIPEKDLWLGILGNISNNISCLLTKDEFTYIWYLYTRYCGKKSNIRVLLNQKLLNKTARLRNDIEFLQINYVDTSFSDSIDKLESISNSIKILRIDSAISPFLYSIFQISLKNKIKLILVDFECTSYLLNKISELLGTCRIYELNFDESIISNYSLFKYLKKSQTLKILKIKNTVISLEDIEDILNSSIEELELIKIEKRDELSYD